MKSKFLYNGISKNKRLILYITVKSYTIEFGLFNQGPSNKYKLVLLLDK